MFGLWTSLIACVLPRAATFHISAVKMMAKTIKIKSRDPKSLGREWQGEKYPHKGLKCPVFFVFFTLPAKCVWKCICMYKFSIQFLHDITSLHYCFCLQVQSVSFWVGNVYMGIHSKNDKVQGPHL